jgi:hypothetical protein
MAIGEKKLALHAAMCSLATLSATAAASWASAMTRHTERAAENLDGGWTSRADVLGSSDLQPTAEMRLDASDTREQSSLGQIVGPCSRAPSLEAHISWRRCAAGLEPDFSMQRKACGLPVGPPDAGLLRPAAGTKRRPPPASSLSHPLQASLEPSYHRPPPPRPRRRGRCSGGQCKPVRGVLQEGGADGVLVPVPEDLVREAPLRGGARLRLRLQGRRPRRHRPGQSLIKGEKLPGKI